MTEIFWNILEALEIDAVQMFEITLQTTIVIPSGLIVKYGDRFRQMRDNTS